MSLKYLDFIILSSVVNYLKKWYKPMSPAHWATNHSSKPPKMGISREKKPRFQALFENSLDAILLTRPNGDILSANPEACRMFGRPEEEIQRLGRACVVDVSDPRLAPALEQRARTGRFHGELTFLRKDGSKFQGEISTVVFMDSDGLEKTSMIIRDVTERMRAVEALLESEERYRAVVEDQTEVISRFKADGTITFVNESYCRFFGKSSHELIGKPWRPKAVAEDVPRIEAQLNTLCPTNPIVVIENRVYSGDREVRWMQFINRGFFDAQGGLTEIQSVGRDITEFKKAENALHAASLYTRSLIEVSLDPLVTINSDGKVMDVNKATELATGVIREKLIGTDFSEYFTESEKAKKGYMKVFKNGSVKDYPLAIRHQSGQITDVLYNASVYRNEAGEIQGVFAAARDITKRKQSEEALRESEIKYRSLYENSMVGIFQIPTEGRLLRINSAFAQMFGYQKPEEMIREISDIGAQLFVHPEQWNVIIRWLGQNGTIRQKEFEMIRRDGSRFWMLLTARVEKEPKGKFIYYEGTTIDITERIWAIEELGRNQDRLRELTARLMYAQESERKKISMELHDEIGQALTAVKINLVEIQKEIPSDIRSDVGARLIETDAIIENMLEQIHQMALDLRPALLDDLGLIPTLRWYTKHFKTRTGLDVRLDTGRPTARLLADQETAVYRIVQEALTNIAKHADATLVRIRMRWKRQAFILSIKDDGKGFDVKTQKNNKNRTGMGLIGIRERAASLNGVMVIDSILGQGTSLSISFPYQGSVNG
jgi:PAS domain S-box-containing protein